MRLGGAASGLLLGVGLLVAILVVLLLPHSLALTVRGVIGWDCGVFLVLGTQWVSILSSDPQETARAALEDPGRAFVFAGVLSVGTVSLIVASILLRRPLDYVPRGQVDDLITGSIITVAIAWAFLHTAYSLHYARLYYTNPGKPGGLAFIGGDPSELDFIYFGFIIGMTFAPSDVTPTTPRMRHAVLGHAVFSFVYNAVILATVISLYASRLLQ
jgi:uncharacterized membrane protein